MDNEKSNKKTSGRQGKRKAASSRKARLARRLFLLGTVAILVFSVTTAARLSQAKKERLAEKERKAAEIAQEESRLLSRRAAIASADALAAGYDFDAAIDLLMQEENYDSDPELATAIAGYVTERSHLEAKDPTQVPHIFFHSLIVDPARAFDAASLGESTAGGNNAWMTTLDEFDKIIEEMYENGWVLVRMRDLVTVNEDGTFTRNKNLLLPVNKKPYVLSVDDFSYYHSYAGQGYADKAVLDADGKVKCQYTDAQGNVEIGDFDVVPRLNSFLEAHPDAAYKGARGMIAMTGYNGVLGYRTDVAYLTGENLDRDQAEWLSAHPDFDYDAEVAEAKKVADAIKASGWEFACHTWGHLSVTNLSVDTLRVDQEKWQNTVAPILGKTDTIIFAHGNDIGSFRDYTEDNEKYAYYRSMGYRFFANVDASTRYWVQIRQDYFRQGRIDCDGYQMWRALSGAAKTNVFEGLFDVSSVFSPARPTPVIAIGKA